MPHAERSGDPLRCLAWRFSHRAALNDCCGLEMLRPCTPPSVCLLGLCLCRGIWQAYGWSSAWSCISSSSNAQLFFACPSPSHARLIPEVRHWLWPCTFAAPSRRRYSFPVLFCAIYSESNPLKIRGARLQVHCCTGLSQHYTIKQGKISVEQRKTMHLSVKKYEILIRDHNVNTKENPLIG